jgi:hypothetical protein
VFPLWPDAREVAGDAGWGHHLVSEELTMKSGFKRLAILLGILGVVDLVMVPVMLDANHLYHDGNPPMPAIVLGAVLGIATLASIRGAAEGRRLAFRVVVITRALDIVTSMLGVLVGPGLLYAIVGAAVVVLSAAAIVMLIRLSPSRALGRAAG